MSKPAEMARASSVTRRRVSKRPADDDDEAMLHRSSVLAGGLTGGGSMSAGSVLVNWASSRATRLASFQVKNKELPSKDEQVAAAAAETGEPKRVSFMALFSFSTTKEKWLMFVGLLAALVAGLAMPTWLLLLAKSLETFNNIGKIINEGGDISILSDQLYSLVISFAVVGVVSLISGAIYVSLWTYTGERQSLRIREKFVRGAFRQEAAWFDTRYGGDPQELPTLAASALNRINDSIGRIVADTFANLLSAMCCLAVSLGLNAPLALMMLCMLPVVAIVIGIVSCFMRKRSGQALEQYSAAGAFATEVIGGIKTVASLCAERWAVTKYEGMARSAQKYSVLSGYLSKLASGLMGLLFYTTYTFAFIFGTEQAARTSEVEESKLNPFYCMFNYCGISGSEVMVCIYGIILCAQFFALMSPGIQAVNLGRTAAVDIFDAIRRQPLIDGFSDKGIKPKDYDGSVEFQNVTFAYPSRPSNIIFNNFNLRIAPGSAVALVGPSGSGKSSIARLLLRLYDPLNGQILAGNVPLVDLNLKWWRSKIGYVPQEPSMFLGTIRDNIACGKLTSGEEVSDQEVIAAAKAACAHEFIMDLPDGYDTFYSGASMSGGQLQRIAIARAMIREPRILLLDEATSALDTESERVVQDAVASIRRTKKLTTITVAHRLSTIVDSDMIAVISEGSIQELGSHKELLREGGIYAELCESQGITAEASDETDNASSVKVDKWVGSMKDTSPKRKDAVVEPSGSAGDIEEALVSDDNDDNSGLDGDKRAEEEKASMKRLWETSSSERGYLCLGLVGGVVVGALPPSEGILFGELTTNLFTLDSQAMREKNQELALYFLLLAAASLFGNMAMGCGFSVSGFRLTRRLRVLVFEKIIRHSMGWFDFPEHSTGELTSRLEEDADAVSNVMGWQLGQSIQLFSSLLWGIVIALIYSWQIGLIAIGCVPFIVGAAFLQATCTKPRVSGSVEGPSAATILERGLNDISLIQAYNLQEDVSDQYAEACKPDEAYKTKQGVISGLVFGFAQFSIFCTFALLFYAGLQLMADQKVDFRDFFVALLAVMFAAFGAGQANADFSARKKGLAAASRIYAIADEPLDKDDPFSLAGSRPSSIDGSVTFESIYFSYPTRPDALIYYPSEGRDGFSLQIQPKQSVAFTGRSGCGKSTALQLLLKFYRVSHGSVKLDKEDVEELNTTWMRGNIGYVGQQPVLFQGSVLDNIRLGKASATEDEIVKAAQAANAEEFIVRLSDGYNTDIGAGGSLLSGGQKQRIAIARAIIKNPKILVLDEATSALDNESERIVQAALDDLQKTQPRTTLIVAHRLETIKGCDGIAVLDRGGVKEFGSHATLLEKKGLYYDLWKKQGIKEE